MIKRFSSRTSKLDQSFLNSQLLEAVSYDRIAGYFSSSILEVAGEAIDNIKGKVRIICNSDLDARDVETARSADMAIKKEWTSKIDEKIADTGQNRFSRLYHLLKSEKIEVRVLPNEYFGLIHGKAGVITRKDGSKTAFMGSVNETWSAWKMNYEILWEDDSSEAIAWVQEEFDALWNHPKIARLSDFIVEDIGRLAKRKIVSLDKWKDDKDPDPASVIIEAPVYRKEYGLWAHQKSFVNLAYEQHVSGIGARLLLADMVGLGKTIQLALAAQLMVLQNSNPVLIIAPKTLIWQWQDEMRYLLDMPSAVWDGKQWVDENGISYPSSGPESIKNCPRLIGIISQGLIIHGSESTTLLLNKQYECIIVDECHRARRKNLKKDGENEPCQPNNLMSFLSLIATKTKSMLLATATPVQLYPIEAYDLLDILSRGNNHVLGNEFSAWRRDKLRTINLSNGTETPELTLDELWEFTRNPLPYASENELIFGTIRRSLNLNEIHDVVEGSRFRDLRPVDRNRLMVYQNKFFINHNPFIRHIVRRTRDFLENEIDPSTNETYLKKVEVILFGEDDAEAIFLPGYLMDAYETAELFCKKLSERMRSAGFLKMLILKRIGSSIEAGKNTAIKMLGNNWETIQEEDDESDNGENAEATAEVTLEMPSRFSQSLTSEEKSILTMLISQLEKHQDKDPKYFKVKELLLEKGWMEYGCIIFSQYFDTIWYMASMLSKDLPTIEIGVYAGGNKSGVLLNGEFTQCSKDELKAKVQSGKIKILFGTDAASEGLNLQRLSTLINIDLPWNPTRLEQRKGRIQRIGQVRDQVYIYNMRYKNSVEDRIHSLLSSRLEQIHQMFGQIPDVLESAWIEIALGNQERAKEIIDAVPQKHPFEMKYNKIENINWESCSTVLNALDRKQQLLKKW
jgi:superfamily II DNA or RNA helicase